MSLIRKHGAVLQAWACLDLVSYALEILTEMELTTYNGRLFHKLITLRNCCVVNIMENFIRFNVIASISPVS